MRELTAISIESDGNYVICQEKDTQDPEKPAQTFRLHVDDQLRSMVCKTTTHPVVTQQPSSNLPTMRPRDIQARIRAGASVEQIAAISGMDISRVQRFAHPVLLERARVAELAGAAHPLLSDGPACSTLSELIHTALIERNLSPDCTQWDAWRIEDGRWKIQVTWNAGHSENIAHFYFIPGAHGGTVTSANTTAAQLVEQDCRQSLSSIAPVVQLEIDQLPNEKPSQSLHPSVELSGKGSSTTKSKHPHGKLQVPPWEEVVLGVRSSAQR